MSVIDKDQVLQTPGILNSIDSPFVLTRPWSIQRLVSALVQRNEKTIPSSIHRIDHRVEVSL
jgi:hypothetical protein